MSRQQRKAEERSDKRSTVHTGGHVSVFLLNKVVIIKFLFTVQNFKF